MPQSERLGDDADVQIFIVDNKDGTAVVARVVPTPDGMPLLVGTMVPDLVCVIYRTGGTHNHKWHRSLAMTRSEGDTALQEVLDMGYAAHVENYFASVAIGLPETYSPDFPLTKEWS